MDDEGILGQSSRLYMQHSPVTSTTPTRKTTKPPMARFGAMAESQRTRPYVNVQRIGYVPTFNLKGEIEVNGERESFE